MPVRVLPVLALVLLGFAPAPFPRAERRRIDPNDLTGTWAIVRWERDGERQEDNEKRYRARFTKEQFYLVNQDDGAAAAYAMRLESAYSPIAFVWRRENFTFVGSFRLHKDEMTIIFNRGSRVEKRPTDFLGEVEYRLILRRVGR
jgi:uncharacterized protein (TIGR03067 family)